MKKIVVGVLALAVWVLALGSVEAAGDFKVESKVVYEVMEAGIAEVRQEVEITNLVTEKYLQEFGLRIEGKSVRGFQALGGEGGQIETTDGEKGRWQVKLPEVIGRGGNQEFEVSYTLEEVVEKKGDVWEVSLPRMDTGVYDELNVEVKIPISLGRLAMVDPKPKTVERLEEMTVLGYDKELLGGRGVVAVFGEVQIYDLSLSYELVNQDREMVVGEMAIPPDSDWQRVIYRRIDPEPDNVRIDKDGNWLAEFRLGSGEKLPVQVQVQVQVFSNAKPLNLMKTDDFSEWLTVDDYWEVDSETLKIKARKYQTSREIYDWVMEKLDYDFNRVGSWETRQGALAALGHPEHAICSDYTDLFVATARAAGIPARQVVGYAYSMHPSLRPVSLIKDVLHTWPEYWNEDQGMWVGVDPTWGETTGGMDYFNQLGLDHVKLVNWGLNSDWPKPPGAYKNGGNNTSSRNDLGNNIGSGSKDIEVKLGVLQPGEMKRRWEVYLDMPWSWPFGEMKGDLILKNKGTMAVYDEDVKVKAKSVRLDEEEIKVLMLPPYGKESVELTMIPDKWSWHGAELELEMETGEVEVVKLPIWVKAWQIVIILGGGGIMGYGFYRISEGLRSIRAKT